MSEDLSKLNLVELFNLLEQPAPPLPISLWPQTIGWVWLGLLLTAALGASVYRFVLWRRANAYRRAALSEIDVAQSDPTKIARILRRTALYAFPREQVASLHGEDWLHFLDTTSAGRDFAEGKGRVLATAPYGKCKNVPELQVLAKKWIRNHKGYTA